LTAAKLQLNVYWTEETTMKNILLGLILLGLAAPAIAKEVNTADFTESARVLAFETHSSGNSSTVSNLNTGAVTGVVTTYSSSDREEIQIGNTVYVTEMLKGAMLTKAFVGTTLPAKVEVIRFRLRHPEVVELLATDKHGKPVVITLMVTGQRVAQ
jgi:hypothetical protein